MRSHGRTITVVPPPTTQPAPPRCRHPSTTKRALGGDVKIAVISRLAPPRSGFEKKRQANKNSPRRPRSTGEPYCASPHRHEQVHVRSKPPRAWTFRKDKPAARQDGRHVATDAESGVPLRFPVFRPGFPVYSPVQVSIQQGLPSAPACDTGKSPRAAPHAFSTRHARRASRPGIASSPSLTAASNHFDRIGVKGRNDSILLSSRSNESCRTPTIGPCPGSTSTPRRSTSPYRKALCSWCHAGLLA